MGLRHATWQQRRKAACMSSVQGDDAPVLWTCSVMLVPVLGDRRPDIDCSEPSHLQRDLVLLRQARVHQVGLQQHADRRGVRCHQVLRHRRAHNLVLYYILGRW